MQPAENAQSFKLYKIWMIFLKTKLKLKRIGFFNRMYAADFIIKLHRGQY